MSDPRTACSNLGGLRQRGFTLIELMVVITLTAIVLGIGVPSFRDLIASQRVKTLAFAFANHAMLARSEAIKRNAAVSLKAQATGWQDGWDVSWGTTRLAHQDGAAGVVIAGQLDGTAVTELSYAGTGRLTQTAGRMTFQFSDVDSRHQRCITFDGNGPPVSRVGACS